MCFSSRQEVLKNLRRQLELEEQDVKRKSEKPTDPESLHLLKKVRRDEDKSPHSGFKPLTDDSESVYAWICQWHFATSWDCVMSVPSVNVWQVWSHASCIMLASDAVFLRAVLILTMADCLRLKDLDSCEPVVLLLVSGFLGLCQELAVNVPVIAFRFSLAALGSQLDWVHEAWGSKMFSWGKWDMKCDVKFDKDKGVRTGEM